MTDDARASLLALVEQWRSMAANAFREGPIPNDEVGHCSRWTAVEMCADELAALLPSVEIRPDEEDRDIREALLPPVSHPLVARCSRCDTPKRDPEQDHPGICVCGGYITDEAPVGQEEPKP